MINATKILWIGSMLVFLALQLITYVILPDYVKLDFSNPDLAGLQLWKPDYFNVCFAIFMLTNASIVGISRLLQIIPNRFVLIPNRPFWTQDRYHYGFFHKKLKAWIKGIGFIKNMFLSLVVWAVYMYNDPFVKYNTLAWFFLLAAAMLAWLVYYFFLFKETPEEL